MECAEEKNGTLIRFDILVELHNLYNVTTSCEIKEQALELIELKTDAKSKTKFAGVWKK